MRLRIWQVVLVLSVLVVWATWPFAAVLGHAVTDLGDPLLNAWALAWNAHALATNPAGFVDANIFHPEPATLAYSELLIVPSLAAAPLLWLGADPILAHNLLVFGGWTLSGVTTFLLVRRLTSDDGAALVAAVAFALYPYRTEVFPKMQLALTFWWPLALLALHDAVVSDRRRAIAAAAVALAAEVYSCLYLGAFGGIVTGVVAVVMALTMTATRIRAVVAVAAAGLGALVLTLPLLVPYREASAVVGERSIQEVASWSATPADYTRAHPESWLYGHDERPGSAERRLFPGFALPVLALSALVPPVARPVAAYVAGTIVAFDLSLGVNGPGYRWLFEYVSPLRALRVPARFGMVVGFTLSVLVGFGMARLLRGRSRRMRLALVSAAVSIVAAEGAMRRQTFFELPDPAPAVYHWLAAQPAGVVAEYPVGPLEGRAGPQDPTYMYYSTRHWKPMVNGYSGFAPASYAELLDALSGFPDDRALTYLHQRGVRYLLVHEPFYLNGDHAADVAALRARTDLRWAGRFRWRSGGSSDVFVLGG